jgi:hypothetical protein
MAVVLVDGFDLYNGAGTNTGLQAKWSGGNVASVLLTTGRFSSGQCVKIPQGAGQCNMVRGLPSSYSSFSHGTAYRAETLPTSGAIASNCSYESSGTPQFGWQADNTGAIRVYRYSNLFTGTLLGATGSGVIGTNTWHYIEIEATISTTTGTINVWVDGVQQLTLTGVNNQNATATTVDSFRYGGGGSFSSQWYQDMDDTYFTDSATRLGERRVETLYPTSDVAQGWTRSTGTTNYTLVDDPQANGDTDYVSTATPGTIDTYGFQDLTGSPATIDAVQVTAFAEKTDASTRAIGLQVISGATTSVGPNFYLNASYTKYDRILTLDPNGNVAWTATAVNALTGGPKVTI